MKRISITRLFFAVVVFILQPGISAGIAEESSKIAVFSVPYNIPALSGTNGQSYPLFVNRFSDCLPGKLYDIRKLFIPHGAKFRDGDFALFSPEHKTLIVKASPEDLEMIDVFVSAVHYDPPVNLVIAGQIQVQGRAKEEKQAKWRILARSGRSCALSSKGNGEIDYSIKINPTITADGEYIVCEIAIKSNYLGCEYSTDTSLTIYSGKQYSMLIGTTSRKEQIQFQITPTVEWAIPPTPNDEPKKKAQLIECIKKHLAEQAPTSANTAPSTAPRQ